MWAEMILALVGLERSLKNAMAPSKGAQKVKILFIIFVIACVAVPLFLVEEEFEFFHKKTTHLVFVGDIMLSRQIGKIIDAQGPIYPFEKIGNVIREADIAFANLENPVSLRGENQGSIYSFRAKPESLKGLVFAGFDIVSIANNHMFDWGATAFTDTMTHLDTFGVDFVGGGRNQKEAHSLKSYTLGNDTYCYLAFTEFAPSSPDENKPGMARLHSERVVSVIRESKESQRCTATIISIHWGEEYNTASNDIQKNLARSFIDAGALLVIGHHPHVVQEIEEYNGGLIAYSLGNFIFDQNFSPETQKSVILKVAVQERRIVSFSTFPIRFTKDFQPYISDNL